MATKRGANRRAEMQEETTGEPVGVRSGAVTSVRKRPEHPARTVVTNVRPQVDCGRRPAKATVGDLLRVEADAFADGHDLLHCELRYRHDADAKWSSAVMVSIGNDRWRALLPICSLGRYRYSVRATIDHFATWSRELKARAEAGQDLTVALLVGVEQIERATLRVRGTDRKMLSALARSLRSAGGELEGAVGEELTQWAGDDSSGTGPLRSLGDLLFSEELGRLMARLADMTGASASDTFAVVAEPAKARFSTWYEMFPRSAASGELRHGTFADVRDRLDYVEEMGFDVLYLPPIHPIGRTGRKGRDGAVSAGPDDPGSPWAIGGAEGGHTAVHPALGSIEDFRALVRDAGSRGIDVAIDLAYNASPDHPWVTAHPEWFRHRPDGSIAYAENPPKKYEDIYPLNFETPEWESLWEELLGVVRYWISEGIRVFRVDNPHTKPFAFWEWLLATVTAEAPGTIFLSEAFTTPRVMEQLAKIGFTQSYTYFTWRNSKWELESYFTELTRSPLADYFRPNLWPNTPDILTEELQKGGRAAFLSRLALAATLGASYGIYGPAFELQENLARSPGSEEYGRSEKYEIRTWDRKSRDSLSEFIGHLNRIRREHVALQFNDTLTFQRVDNDQLIAYAKTRGKAPESDVVVAVVNLDHYYPQSGFVELDLSSLGVDVQRPYVMHDLLTDARYTWEGSHNFVRLDPADVPCHVFSLEQPPARRIPPEGGAR